MADRYWVGGTAIWDGNAGTKWATTSGGTGGASVPTSSDNVFFDVNSNVVTVSASAPAAVCANLTISNGNVTLSGAPQISDNLVMTDIGSTSGLFLYMVGSANATISANPSKSLGRIIIGKDNNTVSVSVITDLNAERIDSGPGILDFTNVAVTEVRLDSLNVQAGEIRFGAATYIVSGLVIENGVTAVPGTASIRIENFNEHDFSIYTPGCPPVEIVSGVVGLYMFGSTYPAVTVSGSGLHLLIGADIGLEQFNIGPNNLITGDFGTWTITMPSTSAASLAIQDITIAAPETLTVVGGVDLGNTTNIDFVAPAMTVSATWVV